MEGMRIKILFTIAVFFLENTNSEEYVAISQLQKQVDFLLKERNNDKLLIQELRSTILKSEKEMRELKSQINGFLQRSSRQAFPNYGAGFTACVSAENVVGLGIHQTIVFDRVITNEGAGYHNTTGVFTAPSDGLYVFHLSLMTKAGNSMYLELVQDGQYVDNMLTDGTGDQGWESGAELWVLKLHRGSEVWVQTQGQGEVHGNCHTMFSGFQLYLTEY